MSMIKLALEGNDGFFNSLSLLPKELDRVREIVAHHWLKVIKDSAGAELATEFGSMGMPRYHEKSYLLDHQNIWPKIVRLLDSEEVLEIRRMSLFRTLENEFGNFQLSDEEDIGRELIYWRLVRPNTTSDIGPLHADAWFWELGHGTTPAGYQRLKVWISIFSDDGVSGFKFSPGSHKLECTYEAVSRHGMIKPQICFDTSKLNVVPFDAKPGDAIVFHDRLIHGGVLGVVKTRVSIEFTMFVKNENYYINN
jgi:hypothetical protein